MNLHFEEFGRGETVLFIQGVGCGGASWRPQIDVLQQRFHCVSFEVQELWFDSFITIDCAVKEVLGLLDHLGVKTAHLVGHSMGAVIAQEIGMAHPEKVKTLSLLCPFYRGKDAVSLSLGMLKHGFATTVGTKPMRRRAFACMVSAPQYIKNLGVERVVRELTSLLQRDLAEMPRYVRMQLKALSRNDSRILLDKLRSIRSLVIAGKYDPISNLCTVNHLSDAICANSRYTLANGSHALPIQNAAEVNRLLISHISNSSI